MKFSFKFGTSQLLCLKTRSMQTFIITLIITIFELYIYLYMSPPTRSAKVTLPQRDLANMRLITFRAKCCECLLEY